MHGVIPGIVLAAGRSSRMGRPKATLPTAGDETFLSRIVGTLLTAGVDDVVIVVGHEAEAVIESFAASGLRARVVLNRDYDRGQLSSLRAGIVAVDRPGVMAALIALVDAPFFTVATVRTVISRYRETRAPVVRPTRADRHGHPFLVDRALFDELLSADPEAGAKPVVRAHATIEGDVFVDDAGAFDDIDTPEEYERRRHETTGASRREAT